MLPLGIYADLQRLYFRRDAELIQRVLLQSAETYRARGIYRVGNAPNLFYFPTGREYDFFLADMRRQGCIHANSFDPTSSAFTAKLKNSINVEKRIASGDSRVFIALTASPSEQGFEFICRPNVSSMVMEALEQSIKQMLIYGVSGDDEFRAMVDGLRVEITALEFERLEIVQKPKTNKLFVMFDWFFDLIDKIFASGSGSDFNTMGGALSPRHRTLIAKASHEVLYTALDDNYTIESGDMQATFRVSLENRTRFLDGIERFPDVKQLANLCNDSYCTFDIGLKTQTFYNNRTFANVLERTDAEIIN